MTISEEQKKSYVSAVREELSRHGIPVSDISRVISKTGFMEALDEYPEEQFHEHPADAAEEILSIAAQA